MQTGPILRGYIVIAMTPFAASGDVMWAEMERECDLIAGSGAHGLVWPINDSEFTTLSHNERMEGMALVAQVGRRRLPVILGVADTSTSGAVAYAREAARLGADAVVAMPPWETKLGSRAQLEDYYRAIADAAGAPVIIQNLSAPRGSELSSAAMIDICRAVPGVHYIKEERLLRQADYISEIAALGGAAVKGVFSGGWSLTICAAHRRGAAGVMRGTSVPEVGARVWNLMEAGNEAEARRIEGALAVLDRAKMGVQTIQGVKQLLVMRGIFTNSALRNSAPRTLDAHHIYELEQGLNLLQSYLDDSR